MQATEVQDATAPQPKDTLYLQVLVLSRWDGSFDSAKGGDVLLPKSR